MRWQPLRLHSVHVGRWRLPGRRARAVLLAIAAGCAGASASAQPAGVAARLAAMEREVAALHAMPLPAAGGVRPPVAQRLTEARHLLAAHDYARADVLLGDVVARDPPEGRAHSDALLLWAEAAYGAKDWLGARARYRRVLSSELATRAAERARALGRLIEIALRTRDLSDVESDFERMSQLPATELGPALRYLRGKYLYALASGEARDDRRPAGRDDPRWARARDEFGAVDAKSPHAAMAGYFMGVIDVQRGAPASALKQFTRVAQGDSTGPQQAQLVELARLALGRLYYEHDLPALALHAYQQVVANANASEAFEHALFERAWVYMRFGDATRAQRSLELLDVAAPRSTQLPEARLLGANLLLRDGRFQEASRAFGEISVRFAPVRDDLDRVLTKHDDQSAYFRALVRDNLDVFDASSFLPISARPWATRDGWMSGALDALSDLEQTGQLVRESEALVARLASALAVDNPAVVFADLRAPTQRAAALRNAVEQLRARLVASELEPGRAYRNPELDAVRSRRQAVERGLDALPTRFEAYAARTARTLERHDALAAELSGLGVELAGMQARVVATERFLSEPRRRPAEPVLAELEGELTRQRAALAEYRARRERLVSELEIGRLRSGAGDLDARADRSLWLAHAELAERERALLRGLGDSPPAPSEEIARLLTLERKLESFVQRLNTVVAERVRTATDVLEVEREQLSRYRQQLVSLQERAQDVVGAIAQRDYQRVRARFYDLVLRADAGVVDVSWAVRENFRLRGELLSRDRVRELKTLDDEYREIAEPAGGEP